MDKKKPILIAIAAICFIGAGVAIAFQLGLIGGGAQPDKVNLTSLPPEPEPTEKEKAVQKKVLEIQADIEKKAIKAGA